MPDVVRAAEVAEPAVYAVHGSKADRALVLVEAFVVCADPAGRSPNCPPRTATLPAISPP